MNHISNEPAGAAVPALRALGNLQLDAGSPVDLGGAKQRALLARLLVDAGRPVSLGRLVDALWGDAAPDHPAVSLRSYVSRLRQALRGVADITLRDTGYSIDVAAPAYDVTLAEHLVETGRRALAAGDAVSACGALEQAVALWRGRAFEEFADDEWAIGESRRLTEIWLHAWEDLADARLATGDHRRLAVDLEVLVDRHPFREGLVARLVTALARSGRQTDALAVLRVHRERLVEELGIEPDPELQRLEHDLLVHAAPLMDAAADRARPAGATGAGARPPRCRRAATRRPSPDGSWWRAA